MRSLLAAAIALGVPIGIGAFAACGPPSSFDHITGAPPATDAASDAPGPLTKDPTLAPPRPLAPLSASFVNGSRPHFRWELHQGTTGAQVIVCRDASCSDPSKKKTWSATGTNLDAPEDLEPGVWFWKLVSTTASQTFGDETSPKTVTWTVFVRGGSGNGAARGQVMDPNGDGIPDLLVSAEAPVSGPENYPSHSYLLLAGTAVGDPSAIRTTLGENEFPISLYTQSADAPIAASDINGDGLTDVTIASTGIIDNRTTATPYIAIVGGDRGTSFAESSLLASPIVPDLDEVPAVVAPGDLDGDGYGDLLVSTKLATIAAFGASDGATAISFFDLLRNNAPPDSGLLPPPPAPIAMAGFDFNGDGISDFATASYYLGPPLTIFKGHFGRNFEPVKLALDPSVPATTPPTAIQSGDFDGDGNTDLVFVTTHGGKSAVCALLATQPITSAALACWVPDPTPEGFATSIAVADLDGADGKDEILVGGAKGGIDLLTPDTPTTLKAEHLASDYGVGITVIHPGRPVPAAWAATRADGSSIAVFRGRDQKRVVLAKDFPFLTKFGKTLR